MSSINEISDQSTVDVLNAWLELETDPIQTSIEPEKDLIGKDGFSQINDDSLKSSEQVSKAA